MNLQTRAAVKELHTILQEITELTTNIETNYPRLYRSLEENQITIPASSQPHVDKVLMQDYLESLEQLLMHHLETHKSK
jgi:hypothetical protein